MDGVGNVAAFDDLPPEIQGKLRQFVRVLMSYVDSQQAAGIAHHIVASDLNQRYPQDRFVLQGLNCGMVVAYCRPFSGNDQEVETKIPSLSPRLLRVLSPEERELHSTLMEERNTILAHSDSRAWEPQPYYIRIGSRDTLIPSFVYVHSPFLREVVQEIEGMATKLMDACFAERERLELELKPYLPVVTDDEDELRRGAPLPHRNDEE